MRPAFFEALTARQQAHFVALERELIARNIACDVVSAVLHVPRQRLVPARVRADAFVDSPLGIGWGQTISQPSLVAEMTQYLAPKPGMRALEVGCGSGYQAAILAQLGVHVTALERIAGHARRTRRRLRQLGYSNIDVVHADGHHGWPPNAPYQAIIVSAAARGIPSPLLEQLDEGGRMVVPVGQEHATQHLVGVRKLKGRCEREELGPVRFVPLLRGRDAGAVSSP